MTHILLKYYYNQSIRLMNLNLNLKRILLNKYNIFISQLKINYFYLVSHPNPRQILLKSRGNYTIYPLFKLMDFPEAAFQFFPSNINP
jgi:hypothetical protein